MQNGSVGHDSTCTERLSHGYFCFFFGGGRGALGIKNLIEKRDTKKSST